MRIEGYHFGNYSYTTDVNKLREEIDKKKADLEMYQAMAASYPKNGRNDALAKEAEKDYNAAKNALKKDNKLGLYLNKTA